ncbi:DMT family transporter [Rhizobium sp. TH2]|uniref:DMT family transporter n=1 Tax=Rhizobium sp. TH2 TaxID=2775403 RepID=UPI0021571F11|nr:DMT family transporter [Rhizobium sp. TH2]UVC08361.1 DMT family transporter [Rhizobium sp. TH2]
MTITEQNTYRLGVAYVAVSAFLWSLSGLFMRAIEADLMTILFLRGLVSGTTVFLLFLAVERDKVWATLKAMRWPTFWAAVLSAASMMAGLGSLYYTSIADSMVIYATAPFITAFIAYFFIGEKPSRATVIASTIAFCGVLYMVTDSQGGGSLLGKGLAVIMSFTVAGLAVVMRKHREVSMLPAMAASAWLVSLTTAPFASPLAASTTDLGLVAAFGIVQNGMGLALYTFGAKRIPAVDASLLTALEVPLTPLWVWIFMNEVPSQATQIGGAIVLAALFGHIFAEMRRNRAPVTVAPL